MRTLWVQVALLAVIAVALLAAMWFGWRRRERRTTAVVPVLPEPPSDLGALRLEVPGTYVSTTLGHDWLERVVAHGLGTRSRALVAVHDHAVVLRRQGAPDVVIPAVRLLGADRSAGQAGKYVGGQGLVVVRWDAPRADDSTSVALATGLRTDHAADRPRLVEAVQALVPVPHDPLREEPA